MKFLKCKEYLYDIEYAEHFWSKYKKCKYKNYKEKILLNQTTVRVNDCSLKDVSGEQNGSSEPGRGMWSVGSWERLPSGLYKEPVHLRKNKKNKNIGRCLDWYFTTNDNLQTWNTDVTWTQEDVWTATSHQNVICSHWTQI